ncbi:GntR family transcriptional regulator, partial [Xanthomonas fragariae]
PAGAAYAAALRLDSPHQNVFVLQRRRWIDRRSVLLETNVVLAAWAPGLLEHDLAGSLSSVFNQKLGLFLSRAKVSMHPAGLDAAQAMLLQSTPGTPCFRLQRISFAEDGRAVELDIESWRHDALEVVVRTEAPTRAASQSR